MHRASLLISLLSLLGAGCGQRGESGPAADSGPPPPPIVAKSIEFHGGPVYDYSAISLTITSRSGSFDIISHREGGAFEYTVTGKVGQLERMVRSTNATVEQWNNGEPVELDQEGQRRARDFVNARVFFPLLRFFRRTAVPTGDSIPTGGGNHLFGSGELRHRRGADPRRHTDTRLHRPEYEAALDRGARVEPL